MKLLLDTHVFIWMQRRSGPALESCSKAAGRCRFRVASTSRSYGLDQPGEGVQSQRCVAASRCSRATVAPSGAPRPGWFPEHRHARFPGVAAVDAARRIVDRDGPCVGLRAIHEGHEEAPPRTLVFSARSSSARLAWIVRRRSAWDRSPRTPDCSAGRARSSARPGCDSPAGPRRGRARSCRPGVHLGGPVASASAILAMRGGRRYAFFPWPT